MDPFDDGDGRTCEICGGDSGELVECKGVLCCVPCADEYAPKLAEHADDLDDDLRNS